MHIHPTLGTEKLSKVLCAKCGQFGRVSNRWVTSRYYPMSVSLSIMMIEYREAQLAKDPNRHSKYLLKSSREMLQEKLYRGEPRKHLFGYDDSENTPDKK
jgi:hypothetical protein